MATLTLTGTLPNGVQGGAYSSYLTIADGTGPYSSPLVTVGALPPGLAISVVSSQLRVIGTLPASAGVFAGTLQVSDAVAATAIATFSITVTASALMFTNRESPEPTTEYASFEYTLISGDTFTFTHGFARRPRVAEVFIKCTTAELGYAVDDEVEISVSNLLSVAVNSTQVKVAMVALPIIVDYLTQAATAVTAANWNLVIKLEQ